MRSWISPNTLYCFVSSILMDIKIIYVYLDQFVHQSSRTILKSLTRVSLTGSKSLFLHLFVSIIGILMAVVLGLCLSGWPYVMSSTFRWPQCWPLLTRTLWPRAEAWCFINISCFSYFMYFNFTVHFDTSALHWLTCTEHTSLWKTVKDIRKANWINFHCLLNPEWAWLIWLRSSIQH